MRAVAKNTFYKSTTINQSIAVRPNFSDLADGGVDTTMKLEGGINPAYYLMSGAVASTPAYGESELIGGYLQLYTEGVTMPTIPSMPQLVLYRTKPGTAINEGSMKTSFVSGNADPSTTKGQTGQNISVYRVAVAQDNYLTVENFDGAKKSLGAVKMMESIGNGTMSLDEAYLDLNVASAKAKSCGNILGNRRLFSLKKYFSNFFIDGDRKVPIEPEGGDTNGVWRPQIDHRAGNTHGVAETTSWKKPYWKYNDIKNKIKFNKKTAVGADIDSAVLASHGNTIFNDVYATADMNNPFTSDVNNPLMMTTCELSTAKKYSGGQAFRMYHLWDYSDQSAQLQLAMGGRALVPSMTRASIYNLPRPHLGLDNASRGVGGVGHLGWQSAAAPVIEMRMNVSKLGFNPFLTCEENSVPVASTAHGYRTFSGTYDGSTTIPDLTTMLGFFRSVTVTWSNYKPKAEHTTLDKFLEYGLNRFYGSSALTTEHVVGGVVFTKTPMDVGQSGGNPSTMAAFALPVTPYQDASSGGILKTQGMAKVGGTLNMVDTLQMVTDKLDIRYGIPSESVDAGIGPRMVVLPMDSWFNMKTFIDGYAKNTTNSAQDDIYSATTTGLETAGVPMRAYFETDVDTVGTTESTAIQNIPFLDIYFPAVSGSSNSGSTNRSTEYSFNDDPNMYPKHMTIWVQNYRWISGSSGTDEGDQNFDNSYDTFFWGDDDAGLKTGAAIEAELFIDDIKLSNWTPEVTNCSIGGSISSQQFFNFGEEGQISPFQVYQDGDYSVRGWALSGQAVSGNLQEVVMQEQLVFGFDNPAQFPNTETNFGDDCYGYILGNGFNTNLFGSLNRAPSNTVAFASVSGTVINQNKIGGQFFGSHYWRPITEAALAYSGTTLSGSDINFSYDSNTVGPAGTYGPSGSVNLATGTTWAFPSTDAFTQKGLFRVAMSGAGFNAANTWTKRENISVATKITGIMGHSGPGDDITSTQFKVASTNIFNKYQDDEFVIFRIGANLNSCTASGSADTLGWGVGADENAVSSGWPFETQALKDANYADRNVLKLADTSAINETDSIVSFSLWRDNNPTSGPWKADDGSTDLFTEEKLSDLWIGPKKYWLTLMWDATNTQRTYQNFCIVQNVDTDGESNEEPTAAAMTGSTWSEAMFSFDSTLRGTLGSSGLYLRPWNLATDPVDSTLVLNEDYGYGAYDEEKGGGGEVSQASALINNWVTLDMMGLAPKVPEEESITFLLGLASESSSQTVTISSDENGDVGKRPIMFWEYKDTLPVFSAPLRVEPNYSILSGSGANKVDLYGLDREELNAVKFTWEEGSEDILYRTLMIDSKPIQNKYSNIYFHAPMNEMPTSSSSKSVNGFYYTGASRNQKIEFTNSTERVITGSAGWAPVVGFPSVGDVTVGPYTATAWTSPWFGATTATFVAHCIPSFTEAGNEMGYLFSDHDGTSRSSVRLALSGAAGTDKDLYVKFQLTSGSAGTSGDQYTLLSDYSFTNDSESPMFIVITFNAALPSNNIKMYVNGSLAAQSAGNWGQNEAIYDGTGYAAGARFTIGNYKYDATYTTQFEGTLQEIIVYENELFVPTQANEFVLSTQYLPDMDSGTEIKYNARLFLYDYHNIIGTSRDTICTSDTATWETTGI